MKSLTALLLAMGLLLASQMACAQDPAPQAPEAPPVAATPDLAEITNRLRSFISDEEMALLYDYMSNSAVAASRGGEVEPLPPELEFKLAILRERLYKEGNAAMEGFMQFLHRELDLTLKKFQLPALPFEPPPPPAPPVPPDRS
ncbi:MAG: hypothetical protein IPG66_15785 [Hydrogenophilales bacterium]|nr:hypothetical protein [Hydrogenophilales bacterium]